MIKKIESLRKEVMRVACKNKKGHIAPSLSCLEILAVLLYDPEFSKDTIILSKGHGCYGLYAILADLGEINKYNWEEFQLPGCLKGFGSLGHGLPVAAGIAFSRKLNKKQGHVFCIVGDGEMQEGSMWEAVNFIQHHKLPITIVVDNNGLQAMDFVSNVLSQNLDARFKAFGLSVDECYGHSYRILLNFLKERNDVLIANTIKGKGYSFMENVPKFHYRLPDDNQR